MNHNGELTFRALAKRRRHIVRNISSPFWNVRRSQNLNYQRLSPVYQSPTDTALQFVSKLFPSMNHNCCCTTDTLAYKKRNFSHNDEVGSAVHWSRRPVCTRMSWVQIHFWPYLAKSLGTVVPDYKVSSCYFHARSHTANKRLITPI